LTDDLERRLQREHQDDDLHLSTEQRKHLRLYELQVILNRNGRSLKDFPPMLLPSSNVAQQLRNQLIREPSWYFNFVASYIKLLPDAGVSKCY